MAKKYKILAQKVYHDGTNMIVLKPGETADVPADLVDTFEREGIIGKEPAQAASANQKPVARPKRDMSALNAARRAKAEAKKAAASKPAPAQEASVALDPPPAD